MSASRSNDKPRLPRRPTHPERICWGCPLYCAADDMRCGADIVRAPHPIELLGETWDEVSPGRIGESP